MPSYHSSLLLPTNDSLLMINITQNVVDSLIFKLVIGKMELPVKYLEKNSVEDAAVEIISIYHSMMGKRVKGIFLFDSDVF